MKEPVREIRKLVKVHLFRWNDVSEIDRQLIRLAVEARKNTVAPYSHFKVGAAILWGHGHRSKGCNIENVPFEVVHAERGAIITGITEHGLDKILKVASVGGEENKEIAIPTNLSHADAAIAAARATFDDAWVVCGYCAQDLTEFSFRDPNIELIDLWNGLVMKITLGDLLTARFQPHHLNVDYAKMMRAEVK